MTDTAVSQPVRAAASLTGGGKSEDSSLSCTETSTVGKHGAQAAPQVQELNTCWGIKPEHYASSKGPNGIKCPKEIRYSKALSRQIQLNRL